MRRAELGLAYWHDSGVVRSDPSRRGGWGAVGPWPIRQPWVGIGRFLVDFGTFCHHVQLSRARLRPFPPISMPTRALTAAEFISCSSLSWPFLVNPSGPGIKLDEPARPVPTGPGVLAHGGWPGAPAAAGHRAVFPDPVALPDPEVAPGPPVCHVLMSSPVIYSALRLLLTPPIPPDK